MKHCPTCKTNFTDDDLGFCTDDGTVLLAGDVPLAGDAQETRVFPEPPATAVMPPPRPTDYGLGSPSPGPPQSPEPYRWSTEAPPPVWTPPPPPPIYPRTQQQQQTVAVVSLVLGIASVTFGWLCGGFILGIAALILGFIALSQIKKNPSRYGGKPLAIGGMVTGGIAFVIHLIILAFWIVMMVIGSVNR